MATCKPPMKYAYNFFTENELGNPVFFLYSCGDGTVLQHDPYKFDKPANDVNKTICKQNGIQVN